MRNPASYSRDVRLEKNPRWRGGRCIDPEGYALLKRPDHPKARKSGYVLEHRFVMEQHLGRILEDHEVVHHKNSIKDDNRLENLELLDGQSDHMRLERVGKKYPRANGVLFHCTACGKDFYRSAYWKDKIVKWCSWSCRYE